MERQHLTLEEATAFFAAIWGGEHHLPGKVKEWGYGFCISGRTYLATFDYDLLTRFVLLCHDRCIRGEIIPNSAPGMVKLAIWKRQGREAGYSDRHPTIEQAIIDHRKRFPLPAPPSNPSN